MSGDKLLVRIAVPAHASSGARPVSTAKAHRQATISIEGAGRKLWEYSHLSRTRGMGEMTRPEARRPRR